MPVLKYKNHLGEWEIVNTNTSNIPNQPTECNMVKVEFTYSEADFELLKNAIDSLPETGGIIYLSGRGDISFDSQKRLVIPSNKDVLFVCYGADLSFWCSEGSFQEYNIFKLEPNSTLTFEGGRLSNPSFEAYENSSCNFKNVYINWGAYVANEYVNLNIDSCTLFTTGINISNGGNFLISSSRIGSGALHLGPAQNTVGFIHNNHIVEDWNLTGGLVAFDNNITGGRFLLGPQDHDENTKCEYYLRNCTFSGSGPDEGLIIYNHNDNCKIYLHNLVGVDTDKYKDTPGVIIQ